VEKRKRRSRACAKERKSVPRSSSAEEKKGGGRGSDKKGRSRSAARLWRQGREACPSPPGEKKKEENFETRKGTNNMGFAHRGVPKDTRAQSRKEYQEKRGPAWSVAPLCHRGRKGERGGAKHEGGETQNLIFRRRSTGK